EAALWAVLDRWNLADVDGWAQLLADATSDDPRLAADLRPKLRRLAESEARAVLASAAELRRGVEFLANLGTFAPSSPSPLAGEGGPRSGPGEGKSST